MEVYLPGAGWVEFDPTNGIIGSERLIRVAVARDPEQAMPIKGTFTGSPEVTVNASVDVQVHTLTPAPVVDPAVPLLPVAPQAPQLPPARSPDLPPDPAAPEASPNQAL
jgi:transglutaminase-like putative cysteine protease